MTLPRCIELQWQQEIIELWLSTSRIPDDSRPGLIEMLSVVKKEVENLRFHDEHSPFEQQRAHSPIRQSRWTLKLDNWRKLPVTPVDNVSAILDAKTRTWRDSQVWCRRSMQRRIRRVGHLSAIQSSFYGPPDFATRSHWSSKPAAYKRSLTVIPL